MSHWGTIPGYPNSKATCSACGREVQSNQSFMCREGTCGLILCDDCWFGNKAAAHAKAMHPNATP